QKFPDCWCFSPLLVKDYSLIVCPKMDPVNVPFSLGDSAVLSCDPNVKEPFTVQWYRRNNLETDNLVVDTKDPHARVPEGFKDKFNVSQLDSSLVLFNLSAEDKGEYWCAALVDIDFLDEGDSDELPDNGYTAQCVFSRRSRLVPTGQEDPSSSSTVAFVVLAVVAGVVILAVLCAVLAIQLIRRRKACQSCRYSSKLPGHQALEGGPRDDVTCTVRLDPTAPSL
uniref:Ig-like domain-containing protein n=1 Tax=Scleropages formosus TaxID=113540 RepID=A0A8C9QTB4_SCLFO